MIIDNDISNHHYILIMKLLFVIDIFFNVYRPASVKKDRSMKGEN